MAVSKPKKGDTVRVPMGIGKVIRVSNMQSNCHVEVEGQLYEVAWEDMEVMARDGIRMETHTHGVPGNTDGLFSQEYGGTFIEGEEPEEEPVAAVKQNQNLNGLDALAQFLKDIDSRIAKHIEKSIDGELKDLRAAVKQNQKLEIKIGSKTNVVEGLRHEQLEDLITVATLRLPALMVGMAGTGKTHAAEQVAAALGVKFYAMSVGAQTSKSDIIGYMNANGDYVTTHFRTAYEKGGVFLMDELDAGNANVLIQVNSALSNGMAAFPDKMVKAHKDFIFIATANTYGTGMNRQYVGRNQLDAATLDRFVIIDWEVDNKLEEALATGKQGKKWYMAVRASRDYVAQHNIRALITPRATVKGCKLLAAGVSVEDVITATMLGSVPDDKKKAVAQVAYKIFSR